MKRLIFLLSLCLIPTVSAQVVIENPTSFAIELLYPILLSIAASYLLWKIFVPSQLANLQVAFEIDDNLYEVHRVTRGRKDVKNLFKLPGMGVGILAYMMAMTGVLLLIAELVFDAGTYYEPNLILMCILIMMPILISPWETLNGQLIGARGGDSRKRKIRLIMRRFLTLSLLIVATAATLFFGLKRDPDAKAMWYGIALLVFMSPTILAYGRIMGASWNMLVINKWRTFLRRPNPIDPDQPGILGQMFSLILVLFLLTMPFAALNGIVTVAHVILNQPADSGDILNYGGIIGHQVYLFIENHPALEEWESLKSMPAVLSLYLSLNIAIVGLAFIFELVRNLFLGGQTFGGMGGVILASPREIRTEEKAQGRVLYFAFAGFSGYTVLLLLLVCYKEFGDLMPFTTWLESRGFDEENRLLTTWMFIAVGQVIFLLAWLLSLGRFGLLKKLKFDLNPDERREGAVMSGGGDWIRDIVDEAAMRDDVDELRRFQYRDLNADEAIVRMEKSRAKMLEMALRGLWPRALEEARKVLAQAGGDDDEARMIIATGHLASRRLDAAREALHNLQQPEGYDEPELLAFIMEWMDPWRGTVTEDDLWDWENNSCIDHLQSLMRMLRGWQPVPSSEALHKDRLSRLASISQVGLLRAQSRIDEALELALNCVKEDPLGVRPRIAVALCLLDSGDWYGALSIWEELHKSDSKDPRVLALGLIMGKDEVREEEIETSLVNVQDIKKRRWVDEAPVNPVAALSVKGGVDEALNANVMITAHEAVRKSMAPRYRSSALSMVVNYLVLLPTWFVLGILVAGERNMLQGIVLTASLVFLHIGLRRFTKQQRKVIRHRDQKAMIAYSRRLRRNKIKLDASSIPVGSHLLLSGLLLSVNGIVYDVGFPGWLVTRLPRDSEKGSKARLSRRAKKMSKASSPRFSPLTAGWWDERPKDADSDKPALQRLIGPPAYRGRQQMIERKLGISSNVSRLGRSSRMPMTKTDMSGKGIPHNTIRSEKKRPGPRKKSKPSLPSVPKHLRKDR